LPKTLENLDRIFARFPAISLQEMDGVMLMNRMDTKFMLSTPQLLAVLSGLPEHYKVLEVNGVRANHYETLYFDTLDFLFYRRHHSGKKNRLKIRKRNYIESHQTYLEVKFKSNKDRTVKDRTKVEDLEPLLTDSAVEFIHRETGEDYDLHPKLYNRFVRTTLVFPEGPERITIDTELSFGYDGQEIQLPGLVIVEVKQSRIGARSVFLQQLKSRHIRSDSFSKYCLGAALLYPDLKQNMFKEKIRKINLVTHAIDSSLLS
jgi:hypothetical protein